MTVAIGLACKDGVLVASDSMASGEGLAIKTQKVHVFGNGPVIWTASGSEYVIDEVTTELSAIDGSKSPSGGPIKILTDPQLASLRTKLHTAVCAGIKRAYASGLMMEPLGRGDILKSYVTDVLVLGYSNRTPWFYEIDRAGQINSHVQRRYGAIGSGGPFAVVALALLSHLMSDELTIEDAKLLAYRTIDTTISVSSSFVGLPVQIAARAWV